MIQTGKQTLGGYTFFWDPDKMGIPEKQKNVAVTETYGGSAIFEWEAILEGTQVQLEWDFMPKGMYKQLRTMYLEVGQDYIWDPNTGGNTYVVRMEKLEGSYMGSAHHESPLRQNIKLNLNIRGLSAILQSTTTTTSTTTTE